MTTTIDKKCPYCGKPYPTITIPSLFGVPARNVQSKVCGCDGEQSALNSAHRRAIQGDLIRAWHGTGVPKRYQDVKPNRDGVSELEFSGGMYMFGPKGTGKTTEACRILKAYVRENQQGGWVSARFVSVPDWLASMRGVWGDQEEEAFQRASRCKLLVLDDIGKGKPTAWAIERLFRLVDSRYNSARPTIYTSQYDLGELGERCTVDGDTETADAMVSRIYETCKGVAFFGEDHRRK